MRPEAVQPSGPLQSHSLGRAREREHSSWSCWPSLDPLISLPDDLIQLTAMCWMREFIQLAGRVMLPYSSGILTAVLPCLAYDDRKKSILHSGHKEKEQPKRGCEAVGPWSGRGGGSLRTHHTSRKPLAPKEQAVELNTGWESKGSTRDRVNAHPQRPPRSPEPIWSSSSGSMVPKPSAPTALPWVREILLVGGPQERALQENIGAS